MPELSWYLRRLKAMSALEIAWRTRSTLRDVLDQACFASGHPRQPAFRLPSAVPEPPFRLTDLPVGGWRDLRPERPESGWCQALCARADTLAAQRFSFFSLQEQYLGDPVEWNRDHEFGQPSPMWFAPSIDYRNAVQAGDAKVVWEPNRHQQLVVLARAYRATGEVRYASAVVEQVRSWIEQCPFPQGMNWRSPLELAIRAISWTWAADLIHESRLVDGVFREQFLRSVHLHLWEITRKYSQGSAANNHLIGEAAGVFIASSYFANLPDAARWKAESRAILLREIALQTNADGGNIELAIGYHLFVLQFFVLAGLVARASGDEMPSSYWSRVESMFDFLAGLLEGGAQLPMLNDADDGYVIDAGSGEPDPMGFVGVGAVLFDRGDLKALRPTPTEAAAWLLGADATRRFEELPAPAPTPLSSRSFPESGLYLLQSGVGRERVSVVFDCAPLGFGSIAAHGHADALSVIVRAYGRDVLVDPGTYDYFRHPEWRRYFRTTIAHNTVTVDGRDQSEMEGPFLWGARARASCLQWRATASGGFVEGEHDGYLRLPDPVRHRRRVELDGRRLLIRDELLARDRHEVAIPFHLAEGWEVVGRDGQALTLALGGDRVRLVFDQCLRVEEFRGCEQPQAGWVSRRYHVKVPSLTLIGRTSIAADSEFECRLEFGLDRVPFGFR
jgi:hypothetical protein